VQTLRLCFPDAGSEELNSTCLPVEDEHYTLAAVQEPGIFAVPYKL
jgi:hypothetical protein